MTAFFPVIVFVLLSLIFPNLIFAQESVVPSSNKITSVDPQISTSNIMESSQFEFLTKKDSIKEELLDDGEIAPNEAKNILNEEILQPEVRKTLKDYTFITGKAGTVEAALPPGEYKVNIEPVKDYDVKIPSAIALKDGYPLIIPVEFKKGSGKVIDSGKTLVSTESNEGVSKGLTRVKVIVVSDSGQPLPWAGVAVKLEKVFHQKDISLLAGWNLITLTALPGKPLTAEGLLQEIKKQGGEATTVSSLENGFWKSYIIRGENNYSLSDFLIEPGKAYFVKALKPSAFSFAGQNFVAPVKLKLSSGWNAVGFPVMSKQYAKPYTVSQLFGDLNSRQAGADTAARWEFGLWDTFVNKDSQGYGEDFDIQSNRGYILKVEKEVEFSP